MSRDPNKRIVFDARIMMGKPVIAGTRITVETILRHLGTGETIDDLLREYPQLTKEDIRAAQSWAADYLADEISVDLD